MNNGKGMRIAGLVLGILGILCSILGFSINPWLAVVALPVAIVGLILACVGLKGQKDGLGIAALVLTIIATVFSTITFFTCGICVICAASAILA